jgi:type 2A phosphatase activator TIP41
MTEAVAIPHHTLHESKKSRSIELSGWHITATTDRISSASDCDALQASLGFALPEMTFGRNRLTLEHQPSGWKYSFATEAALKGVKNGELEEGDGGVKVGYADKWMESRYVGLTQKVAADTQSANRTKPSSTLPMPKTVPTKPYDWTYTTTYAGHEDSAPSASRSAPLWRPAEAGNSSHAIPYAELSRPDPILFYAEIPLFEDELHDNGSSNLLVKIVSFSGFFNTSIL